ncbi:MAG: hypothetical protein KJ621_07155 [Proteobacteria bacterium]|nr:hypothetical protein [Pseudomonadota bacterium]
MISLFKDLEKRTGLEEDVGTNSLASGGMRLNKQVLGRFLFGPDIDIHQETGEVSSGASEFIQPSLERRRHLKVVGESTRPKKGLITEKLFDWWVGRILNIFKEEQYIRVVVRDTLGHTSYAEFTFDKVSELCGTKEWLEEYLFEGSSFVYSVFSERHESDVTTRSAIEFLAPTYWSKEFEMAVEMDYSISFSETWRENNSES